MIWKKYTTYTGIPGMKSSVMSLSDDNSTILSMSEVRSLQSFGYNGGNGPAIHPVIKVYYENFIVELTYTNRGREKGLVPIDLDYEQCDRDYTWIHDQVFGKKELEITRDDDEEGPPSVRASLKP